MENQRALVGYIPASNPEELDYDFAGIVPADVEMVGAAPTLPITLVTEEAIEAAEAGLEEVARTLARKGAQAVIVSIAPLIYVRGYGYDRDIIERVCRATGLPASTNQTAAVEAFRALGVERIVLLNPNTSDLLQSQVEFFEKSGVHVVAARSMDILDNRDIDRVDETTSYRFISETIGAASPADGVYLSGPCWRTLNLIDPLERETGMAVVTALQAMVWEGIRLVGLHRDVSGYGRLMHP